MWILWLAMVWFMVTRLGRGRRHWSHQRRFGHHGPPWMRRELQQSAPRALSASERREQEMKELRGRYVADDITVEEYERELDRVLATQRSNDLGNSSRPT